MVNKWAERKTRNANFFLHGNVLVVRGTLPPDKNVYLLNSFLWLRNKTVAFLVYWGTYLTNSCVVWRNQHPSTSSKKEKDWRLLHSSCTSTRRYRTEVNQRQKTVHLIIILIRLLNSTTKRHMVLITPWPRPMPRQTNRRTLLHTDDTTFLLRIPPKT